MDSVRWVSSVGDAWLLLEQIFPPVLHVVLQRQTSRGSRRSRSKVSNLLVNSSNRRSSALSERAPFQYMFLLRHVWLRARRVPCEMDWIDWEVSLHRLRWTHLRQRCSCGSIRKKISVSSGQKFSDVCLFCLDDWRDFPVYDGVLPVVCEPLPLVDSWCYDWWWWSVDSTSVAACVVVFLLLSDNAIHSIFGIVVFRFYLCKPGFDVELATKSFHLQLPDQLSIAVRARFRVES